MNTANLRVIFSILLFFPGVATADYLKPDYYVDQCAELAFEVAYDNQKFVKDEFEYFPPSIVDYEDSPSAVDVSIVLEQ